MARSMARTPQPHYVSSWMSAFASFVEAHGFAVNLFVVVVLAALGLAFMAKRTAIVGCPAVLVSVVVWAWPTGCWWRTLASSVGRAPIRTA